MSRLQQPLDFDACLSLSEGKRERRSAGSILDQVQAKGSSVTASGIPGGLSQPSEEKCSCLSFPAFLNHWLEEAHSRHGLSKCGNRFQAATAGSSSIVLPLAESLGYAFSSLLHDPVE